MAIYIISKRHIYMVAVAILILVVAVILIWQFATKSTVSNVHLKYTYGRLLPEEAQMVISNNPDIVILDIRSTGEYERGHIKGAISFPYRQIKSSLSLLDTDTVYIIYCNNGKDSIRASRLMAESGFPRVFIIVGGYNKWPYEIGKITNSSY